MTKSRSVSASGSSRDRLLGAALELLAAEGWSGLTSRKLATIAAVNVGLIHYYFGGMPGLRRAAMAHAVERTTAQLQQALLDAATPTEAVAALGEALAAPRSGQEPLIAAVLAGAAVDPELRAVVGDGLRQARDKLADSLPGLGVDWPEERRAAMAALLMAALDGLVLHALADDGTPALGALRMLMQLLPGDTNTPQESGR